jgi:hypothetical protein
MTTDRPKGNITVSRDHLWPWIIGIALAVVLAVNAAFIYIAVSGADSVAPSYNARER